MLASRRRLNKTLYHYHFYYSFGKERSLRFGALADSLSNGWIHTLDTNQIRRWLILGVVVKTVRARYIVIEKHDVSWNINGTF